MLEEQEPIIEIFCSYAEKDEYLVKELEKHLASLKRQGLITIWNYQKIMAGEEKLKRAEEHLNRAHIILLLVSSDFISSDYCHNVEMKRALERYEKGEAYVVPVILRPVYWQDTLFGKLFPLPRNGQAITERRGRHGRDKSFLEVTLGIRDIIEASKERWFLGKNENIKKGCLPEFTTSNPQPASLNEPIALINTYRANVLLDLDCYEEATKVYTLAISLDPNYAPAYYGKGEALYKLRYYDEALVLYQQALHLDPGNAGIYTDTGDVLLCLGRLVEALAAYEEALCLDLCNISAYTGKIDILQKLGKVDEATATYRAKANALYKLGYLDEALLTYEQILLYDSHNITAYIEKANILHYFERYDETLLAYQQALDIDPLNTVANIGRIDALLNIAIINSKLENYDQNTYLDINSIKKYKNNAEIIYRTRGLKAAINYCLDGAATSRRSLHLFKALAAYEEALRLDPSNVVAHINKADVLYILGHFEKALTAYHRVLVLEPNNISALIGRADILCNLQRFAEALVSYKEILRLDPNNINAYKGKGDALCKLKRIDEALLAYKSIGDVHFRSGHLEEALVAYVEVLHLNPDYVVARIGKAHVLRNLERFEEAFTAYHRVLVLEPNNIPALIGRADILCNLQRFAEALASYKEVLRLDPNNINAYKGKERVLANRSTKSLKSLFLPAHPPKK